MGRNREPMERAGVRVVSGSKSSAHADDAIRSCFARVLFALARKVVDLAQMAPDFSRVGFARARGFVAIAQALSAKARRRFLLRRGLSNSRGGSPLLRGPSSNWRGRSSNRHRHSLNLRRWSLNSRRVALKSRRCSSSLRRFAQFDWNQGFKRGDPNPVLTGIHAFRLLFVGGLGVNHRPGFAVTGESRRSARARWWCRRC